MIGGPEITQQQIDLREDARLLADLTVTLINITQALTPTSLVPLKLSIERSVNAVSARIERAVGVPE